MDIDFNALGNQFIQLGLQLLAAVVVFIIGRLIAGFLSAFLGRMLKKANVDDTLYTSSFNIALLG